MQIVIDIPEENYKSCLTSEYVRKVIYCDLVYAIRRGTPLQKGHGRIVDESKIKKCGWNFINHHAKTDAPTIIEADKESD